MITTNYSCRISATCVGSARLTNDIRIELHHQGALVVTVRASFIDTDMAALVDASKGSPESVASRPSTPSRLARSRYSLTSGPGSSRLAVTRSRADLPSGAGVCNAALKGTE